MLISMRRVDPPIFIYLAQVELGASKSDARAAACIMLDPELQHRDEDDTRSLRKAAAGQTLALSAGTELRVGGQIYAAAADHLMIKVCHLSLLWAGLMKVIISTKLASTDKDPQSNPSAASRALRSIVPYWWYGQHLDARLVSNVPPRCSLVMGCVMCMLHARR